MRCLPIRSVLRAALTAGLIASCQHATVQASWKDYLPSSIGTCYVHDLHWDRFQTTPKVSESIIKHADQEADLCMAAAKQFELKMQVEAILESLSSKSKLAVEFATKSIVSVARSQRILVATIKSLDWKIVEVPETYDPVPVASLSADEVLELGYDWNCGEWCRAQRQSETVSLPQRDVANIFVYSLVEAQDSPVSSEAFETTTDYAAIDVENLLSEAERTAWASDLVLSANPWQVGVDPVCAEIQDNAALHPICCPVESENEAIATAVPNLTPPPTELQPETQIAARPPRLDAEFESNEATFVLAENTSESFEQYAHEYGDSWLNSLSSSPWTCQIGRRFSFGDNAPRMPKSGPAVDVFSKEDIPSLDASSTELISSRSTFSSKDFLTTLHTSTYGSILLPVSQTHRTAIDYAMQLLSKPSSESRSMASRGLASQLRNVGQFLVNFASQIEQQADQVEIARRESNQR